jgi:hypothetical protein
MTLADSRAIYEAKVTEHDVQVDVVEYLHTAYPNVLFWSTPNGARLASGKDKRLAAIRMNGLKAEGLLPGVSDLIIFEPRGGYSAMFLELKRPGGGAGASDNQMWFLREVEARGGYGIVAEGFEQARVSLDDYLNEKIIADCAEVKNK